MSKHLGNVIFLDDAVKSFGPDAVRLYLATGCSQWADFNWSNKIAQNYVDLVSQIKEIINRASEPGERDHMERWLNSRFNRMLEVITALLEKNEIKKATDMLVFSFINDLKWYTARCARQPSKEILKKWLVALSIFIPFTADELWQKFGKGDIFSQSWPEPDQAAINPKVEAEEEVIRNVLEDVNEIKKITKAKKINKVTLIVSEKWKYEVWNMVVAGAQTKESSEYDVLCSAKDFFKRTLGCDVEVLRAAALLNPSPELAKKAKVATPGKPGIVIEAEQ
jgi:leucyl-tRNA synthetase